MLVRNQGLGTNRSGPTTHLYGHTAGALSKRLSLGHVRAVNLKLLVGPANPAQFHECPQRDTGWDPCTAGSFWPSTTCLPGEHSWGQGARIQGSSLEVLSRSAQRAGRNRTEDKTAVSCTSQLSYALGNEAGWKAKCFQIEGICSFEIHLIPQWVCF